MPCCLTAQPDEGMKGRKTGGIIALTSLGLIATRPKCLLPSRHESNLGLMPKATDILSPRVLRGISP
jgi:hypothetical protein